MPVSPYTACSCPAIAAASTTCSRRCATCYPPTTAGATGTAATVKIGNETVDSYDAVAAGDQAKAKDAAFVKAVNISLQDGGYPLKRAAVAQAS